MEITVEAKLEKITEITAFMDGLLEEQDCSMKAQTQLDIILDELFSNIARYAYEGKEGTATLSLQFEADPKRVVLSLTDSGMPFNPLLKEEPDVTLAAEDRPIGGLGIFLVRKMVDDIRYEYTDSKNILTLEKRI